MSDDGISLPDWIPTSEPTWWSNASKVIGGIVGISAGGIALVDDPIGFVQAVIAEWVVGGVLDIGAQLAGVVIIVNRQIQSALGDAGDAVVDAAGTLTIPAQILFDLLESGIEWAVLQAGPLAPLVWVGAYIGALLIGAFVVRATIELVRVVW